ncbi:PepSY domain-containing protein [Bacillus carboniphilus]|uniref:PepSY domain-containing protein n=1 Tax=Bacillus carboniphilus TaxID=86663 RepID=A0ABY9JTY3_9BACI|nr:PepSY domain-containing protein [Bacillus carboniphilus]WLR41146.1 PepSY domain-containing protein [Bacillus carboniphilus]
MKWKKTVAGISIALLTAYVVKKKLDTPYISSEKALQLAKESLKEKGMIDGSWIYTEAEDYIQNDLSYKVYKAGISTNSGGENSQYELIIDAETGTILKAQKK